ncbi:MAG: hypothetical protein LH617_15240 [Ramlibacter sp.]|nr:hypothetical protein [Ramlibacter sp.]
MIRLRFLMLWLVMAAVPLQGLAAASMLYCGMGAQHGTAHSIPVPASAAPAHLGSDASDPDHLSHVSHASHASQGHVAVADIVQPLDSQQQLPGADHECSVCASCSNAVLITTLSSSAGAMPLPQAELAEPFVLIQRRPAPVPDKPPRA